MRAFHAQRNGQDRHLIKYYSRKFREACRAAGITGKKFHSLRHTFAVRHYLQTRDIYAVAKQLGHASVTTTEIYAKFNLKRLEQDFPDLASRKHGARVTSLATDPPSMPQNTATHG